MSVIVVIPARLQSTRLPNKLLLAETGHHLIWHTIQRVREAKTVDRIYVATEDADIFNAIIRYQDIRVCPYMTDKCNSGTERVAYMVNLLDLNNHDIIVNFQGDEPELPGSYIDELVAQMFRYSSSDVSTVATLAAPATEEEKISPDVVKVVTTSDNVALYFSRAPIPYNGPALKHFGLYAYRADFLRNLDIMRASDRRFEGERLEQLQWLNAGHRIKVVIGDIKFAGIDTRAEYEQFVKRYLSQVAGSTQ